MNYSASPGQTPPETLLHVAVQAPMRQLFTYAPPPDCDAADCPPGTRLWVPFGRQRLLGIVLEHTVDSDLPDVRIRPALARLDRNPLLGEADLELARFTWSYYHLPPGQVLTWLLPPRLRKQQHSDKVLPDRVDKAAQPPKVNADVELPTLTDEQQQALAALEAQPSGFAQTLLEGVTGSGKTEIYLRRIAKVLEQGGQVLYLVPEIGLTPQAEIRIGERFSASFASLHSRISPAKRLQIWNRARTGELDILIGTRSAVFTPLPRLGLILVDEEHDSSLRQDQGAPYSARDLAVWRASKRKIPIILGSATPALETLVRARAGQCQHLQLHYRVDGTRPPTLDILDRRKVPQAEIYGPQTVAQVRDELTAGRQALLFLNRRGWARVLMCLHCGWRCQCQHCDAPAVLHLRRQMLLCHHCGRRSPLLEQCPQCSQLLSPTDPGTEKLEHWCQRQFPDTPILRIDSDSTTSADALKKLLEQAQTQTPALLIGTSMLTKGHHLPHLGLVAIADTSAGLMHPDFRGGELTAQTLIQVAGRAGREMRGGKVLLETSLPDHPLLKMLAAGDYPSVATQLLEQRQRAGLPPFTYLAALMAESSRQGQALNSLQEIKERLPQVNGVEVIGPMPRAMEKFNDRWRALLQFRSGNRAALHHLLDHAASEIAQPDPVTYSLVVDPLETL